MKYLSILILLMMSFAQAELQTVAVKGRDPFHSRKQTYQVILSLPAKANPESEVLLFQTQQDLDYLKFARKYFPFAFAEMSKETSAFTLNTDWSVTQDIAAAMGITKPRAAIFIDANTDRFMVAHKLQHAGDFHTGRYGQWTTLLNQIPVLAKKPSLMQAILQVGLEWRGYSTEVVELQKFPDSNNAIRDSKAVFIYLYSSHIKMIKDLQSESPAAYQAVYSWLKQIEIKNSVFPVNMFEN